MKKGILIGALAGGLTLGGATAQAGSTIEVADGTELAAAIVKANSKPWIRRIACATRKGCDVVGTLPTYTGTQRLIIDGRFSAIDASGVDDADAVSSVGGANLRLARLTITGGLSGIYVEVPSTRTGKVTVEFISVVVRGAALHGAYVGDADKAPASISVISKKSRFINNGHSGLVDQDGLLVEETGKGSVFLNVTNSKFKLNDADGLGVLEFGPGRVVATVDGSFFNGNGQNPNKPGDPDDGFDIDEHQYGDVSVTITNTRLSNNSDDGLDLDERDGGSLNINLTEVKTVSNKDQGMTFDERGNGDLLADLTDSVVANNDIGSQGIDLRGDQLDAGVGFLILDNTVLGNTSLHGIN